MNAAGGARPIRLTMQANDVLPDGLSWSILDGYVRTAAWDESGESITLGVWGPGEWVTNTFSTLRPVEMQCLSAVRVEQFDPSEVDILNFLQLQT